jgi:pyrroloquinoline quinone (PQQ) biosynthesis protein C
MPVNYVVEMVCDRIAANKIYNRDEYKDENPLHYFEESQEQHLIHEDTKALLRELLTMLKEKGEKSTFQYIREVVLDSSYEY